MSTAEIIEEIRKLPPSEQELVLEFLQHERSQPNEHEVGVHYASDDDFDRAADKVMREHAELFRCLAQ